MTRIATLLAALTLATAAEAADFRQGSLEILDPQAASTVPGQMSGGAFMLIRNDGDAPDYLIGAEGAMAKELQVHQTKVDAAGVATMTAVPALEIPAHGEVALQHGSYHIMLMGLAKPLTKGETLPLTLIFRNAGRVTVQMTVGGPMAGMKMGG